MELIRNPKTGIVEVWEHGKKIGEIITMGDQIKSKFDDPAQVAHRVSQDDLNGVKRLDNWYHMQIMIQFAYNFDKRSDRYDNFTRIN